MSSPVTRSAQVDQGQRLPTYLPGTRTIVTRGGKWAHAGDFTRDVSPWVTTSVQDIADDQTIVGTCRSGVGELFIARGGEIRIVSTGEFRPETAPHNVFVSGDATIVFNSIDPSAPKNAGPTSNSFAMRATGTALEFLPYRSAGARGSQAIEMNEAGDVCGNLLFGPTRAPLGAVQERTRAVVWTAKGELIELEEMPNWTSSSALAAHSKDLVFGYAWIGPKQLNVLWKRGKPELAELPKGAVLGDYSFAPSGDPIAIINFDRKGDDLYRFIDKKWVKLKSLSEGLPANASLRNVLDVASDGSILAMGIWNGRSTFFQFKPVEIVKGESSLASAS